MWSTNCTTNGGRIKKKCAIDSVKAKRPRLHWASTASVQSYLDLALSLSLSYFLQLVSSFRMPPGGVFVVLLCGLAVAVLIAIIEFCWNSKKSAAYENVRCPNFEPWEGETLIFLSFKYIIRKQQQSLCTEMAEEFCFAVRCRGSGQRPAFKRKCSQCVTHCSYLREMDIASHHVPVPANGLSKRIASVLPIKSMKSTFSLFCFNFRFSRRFYYRSPKRMPVQYRCLRVPFIRSSKIIQKWSPLSCWK